MTISKREKDVKVSKLGLGEGICAWDRGAFKAEPTIRWCYWGKWREESPQDVGILGSGYDIHISCQDVKFHKTLVMMWRS